MSTPTEAVPTHSRLAPSAASRWTVCTASIPFIEANKDLLPADNGGEFADEGTRAHAAAAALLEEKVPKFDNEEMAGHVARYVDFVEDKIGPDDRILIEKRLPLFYFPKQRGTLDVAIIGPKGIYIIDLKYGVGVGVYAKGNKQLVSYAESLIQSLEAVDEIPDETLVTLVIYQPRDRNDPNPVRLWAITRGELREHAVGIADAATQILQGDPGEFVADPEGHCRFCPAKGICKAYATYGLDVIPDATVEEPRMPDPKALTREQRIRIIKATPAIKKFLEAVEDQEVHELMNNAPRVGFKLVEGKTNRTWSDEDAVEKLLKNHLDADAIRPPGKLVSPAGAEELLKDLTVSTKFQNKLNGLIVKPQGKPSLVPEEDKRPALSFHEDQVLTKIQPEEAYDCI